MKNRIFFIILIIGFFLLLNSWNCLMLNLGNAPAVIQKNIDKTTNKVLLLYGQGICGTCSSGTFLHQEGFMENILILVPQEFTDNEIDNLRYAFSIKGKIRRGDEGVISFVKKVASCTKMDRWNKNYYIEMDDGKIKAMKPF